MAPPTGLPPPGIMVASQQINQPPMNALQNLLATPGVVSVESLEGHQQQQQKMPPLPRQAKGEY